MTSHLSYGQEVDGASAREGLLFVFVAVLLYSIVHVGFRLLASDVLGEDDIIDTILVQDLRIGYDAFPRQPPLYDWVLWCVQQVTGPGVLGFLLIKYAALVATACLLYLTSLRVLKDRLFAILSVESLALIYQISWRFHEGFTHEVGAMVCVMACAWLFVRLIEYGRMIDYTVLGVVVGLGLLTEPAFGVFFVSLVGAGLLQPGIRSRVLHPGFLVTLGLGVVVASPYVWWVLSEPHRIKALYRPSRDFFGDAMSGLGDALRGPIAYLSPLLFILPVVFPFRRFVLTAWEDLRRGAGACDGDGVEPDLSRLFLHAMLIALGLCVAGALVFAIKGFAVHVLMPLYLTSVIWLFSVAKRSVGTGARIKWFTRVAISIAVIALLARLANMFVLDPVCNKCRWGIPYDALGVEMRARGFESGTIISIDRELAGNLRRIFPASKIVTRRYPRFIPKGVNLRSGKVAFVWGTQLSLKDVNRYMREFLPPGRSFEEAALLRIPWQHIYKRDGYRFNEWRLLVVDMDREQWVSVPDS